MIFIQFSIFCLFNPIFSQDNYIPFARVCTALDHLKCHHTILGNQFKVSLAFYYLIYTKLAISFCKDFLQIYYDAEYAGMFGCTGSRLKKNQPVIVLNRF